MGGLPAPAAIARLSSAGASSAPRERVSGALDAAPDRLTRPLVRQGGRLVETGWAEAYQAVADGLGRVIAEGGPQAIGGGTNRCTLQIHPADAARIGLVEGVAARVKGDVGELEVAVEITDTMRPGVVSLPHGWGHDSPGTRLSVATREPGVNVNRLLDGARLDPLSNTAVLNGAPVEVTAAASGGA